MSIASQDVFLNLQTPLSVIGGGGPGPGGVDSVAGTGNIVNIGATTGNVSLNTAGALTNISSLGFAAGGGALTGISSINGLPYSVSAVPSNLTVSTLNVSSFASVSSLTANDISTFALGVSSINGTGPPRRYVGVGTPLTSYSTNVNISGSGTTLVFGTAGFQPSTIILANREGNVNMSFKVSSIGTAGAEYISTSVGIGAVTPGDNIQLLMNFTQLSGGSYFTYAQVPCNSFWANGVFGASVGGGFCTLVAPVLATSSGSYLASIQATYSPSAFNTIGARPPVDTQSIQIFYQDINVQAL